jgi:hypothetical protein
VYSDDPQEKESLQDLDDRAKVSVENQKDKAGLAEQKAIVVWSGQTLKSRDIRFVRRGLL